MLKYLNAMLLSSLVFLLISCSIKKDCHRCQSLTFHREYFDLLLEEKKNFDQPLGASTITMASISMHEQEEPVLSRDKAVSVFINIIDDGDALELFWGEDIAYKVFEYRGYWILAYCQLEPYEVYKQVFVKKSTVIPWRLKNSNTVANA